MDLSAARDVCFERPGLVGPQIRAGNTVRWPYLKVPTAPIDGRDIAAVAVRTLCEDGHSGAEYVLTGPQSLTQFEQIATIGSVLGRSLRIEEISPEDWLSELPTFLPAFVAKYLMEAWSAATGLSAFVTSTVAELTGAPAWSFFEWASDHAAQFQA